MRPEYRTIIRAIVEFFVLSVLTLGVTLLALVDTYVIDFNLFPFLPNWLDSAQSEWSATQVLQHLMLLASAVVFWRVAVRDPAQRGFAVLAAGLFACMFIRELDGLLDHIQHGFWAYPAGATALASIAYAAWCRGTTLEALAGFSGTKPYYFILFGLIAVIVLSQTLGSGQLLWREKMGDAYSGEYKRVLQEGLELFGYIFVLYGSLLHGSKPSPAQPPGNSNAAAMPK